ncbi:MAG: hypothetical protein Q9191_004742 [Dirinaria sp. TL-2023a]
MLGANFSATNECLAKLTFNDGELLKTRPRPKSRLASYLSTNGETDQSDVPSFDWTTLGEEIDEAYEPVPTILSHTLQQHVLNNPIGDLPARYNNLILRLVEDHRRLGKENERLLEELRKEIESHMEDNERFRQTMELYLRKREVAGRAVLEEAASGGTDLSPQQGFQSGSSAAPVSRLPVAHVDSHPIHSSSENSPQKDRTRRQYISPSRNMTLITRAVLAADEKVETILTPPPHHKPAPPRKCNTLPEKEAFPAPTTDPENLSLWTEHPASSHPALLISRLTERLASRIQCHPHQIHNEVLDTCNELREANSLHKRTTSGPKTSGTQPAEQKRGTRFTPTHTSETQGTPQSAIDSHHPRNHQRSFSFLPGDDNQSALISGI